MTTRVLLPFRDPLRIAPYERALRAAELEPVPVSASGAATLNGVSGLLLAGGTDVNPSRYGESPATETEAPDDERDALEIDLIHEAIHRDIPLLAICRGLQILNVYHGGTLIQHLSSVPRHAVQSEDKAAPAHEVAIEHGSKLREIAGTARWHVNSRHHQAAAKVGAGLLVTARDAEDGTIEALERPGPSFVLAVQWHPEDQILKHPGQLKLFQHFAKACR